MVASLTTSTSHRKSSKEAHAVRRDEKEYDDIRKSAFRVGTVLLDTVQSGENTLSQFCSAEKCADLTNGMFGIELVSGYGLKEGLKRGPRGAVNKDTGR